MSAATHWPTPPAVTCALLAVHPPPPDDEILEPSAGEGGIVAVLVKAGHQVTAVEVRQDCYTALIDAGARLVCTCDWLAASFCAETIIGNPPYDPADAMLAHVAACLLRARTYCALLLPVTFMCSGGRRALNQQHPVNGYYPFARRPSTSGDGKTGYRDLAWHVWDRRMGREQRVQTISWEPFDVAA